VSFEGFPTAALDFYDDLEVRETRYDFCVKHTNSAKSLTTTVAAFVASATSAA